MLTSLCIIGTRPEAIKMAPVIRELARHPRRVRSVVCSTGQHRQMLRDVFELFEIRPDVELDVMKSDQSLTGLTARLLESLDPLFCRYRPDCVLAQGDTTTVLASAMAAFYRGIPFGHVEAGLRTGNLRHPFPEELNRCVADMTAKWLFAPTERSRQTLLREGYPDESISVTGNTVIDALHYASTLPNDGSAGPLRDLPADRRVVLVTAHRRESFGEPFRNICEAIRDLALQFERKGIHFVYPVHMNPNVRQPVKDILAGASNISLIEPLDYLSLVHLMKRSILILTDSGGIQEEAPALGIPVLVMRETTERPEGVEAGAVKVVGTSRHRIREEAARLLDDAEQRRSMAKSINPYGDGRAASRIVSTILENGC